MKEKRYTLPDNQDAAFASEPEPTVAYHGNVAITLPKDEVNEPEQTDDFDWNKMPFMGGPTNEEEAIARIEAIEADYEKTGISYTVDEFFQKLHTERAWQR